MRLERCRELRGRNKARIFRLLEPLAAPSWTRNSVVGSVYHRIPLRSVAAWLLSREPEPLRGIKAEKVVGLFQARMAYGWGL